MMNELYDLCENLKVELKEINQKGDISPAELDRVYKAVDIIKDIKTVEAMEEAGNSYNYYDGGQSGRMYPGYYYDEPGMSNARRGRDGDGDGRYSETNSYRRSRDYSRDGGYSGHEDKEHMIRQIEELKRKVQQM